MESQLNFRRVLLITLVLLTVISILFGLSPTSVHATNITVDPQSGTVGTQISVNGGGFVGRLATIFWDDKRLIQNIPVSKDGQISYIFEVPSSAKGLHVVKVTDDSNWENVNASISFSVTPNVSAQPPWGKAPNVITLFGNGFAPNETGITATWEDQKLSKSSITADKSGTWHVNFDVPGIARGEYTIRAYGDSTPASEVPPLLFTIGPYCKAVPLSGPVGTKIMISGVGFRPGEDGVTFTWDGPIIDTNFVAEANGTFSYPIIVPPSIKGRHIVGIYGSSFTPKGIIPDIEFEVTPTIKLIPSNIENSKDVRVDGSGFNAGELIAINYDKLNAGASATTDSKGSFSLTFQTPYSPGKDHTVTATGNKGTSFQAIYTLTVMTPPTPDLRFPGPGAKLETHDSVFDTLLSLVGSISRVFHIPFSGKDGNDIVLATLNWAVAADQTGLTYTLQISKTQDFASVLFNRDKIPTNAFDLNKSSLPAAGVYYWRVRSSNDSGDTSPWSNMWSFEILPTSPLVPIISIAIVILLLAVVAFGIIALVSRIRNQQY